jgi:hypothetical protein
VSKPCPHPVLYKHMQSLYQTHTFLDSTCFSDLYEDMTLYWPHTESTSLQHQVPFVRAPTHVPLLLISGQALNTAEEIKYMPSATLKVPRHSTTAAAAARRPNCPRLQVHKPSAAHSHVKSDSSSIMNPVLSTPAT